MTVPMSTPGSIGSPYLIALRLLQQQLDKPVGDRLLHQHALDSGAALAGVLVRAGGSQRRSFLEVGVFHHDQRIVAAELEHLALVDRLGRRCICRPRCRR